MRRFLFVAGLVLTAVTTVRAQGGWAPYGGLAMGTPNDLYTVAAASSTGGFAVGVIGTPMDPKSTLNIHFDFNVSQLHYPAGAGGSVPGLPNPLHFTDTHVNAGGVAANVTWNVLGSGAAVTPYLLGGGMGYFVVSSWRTLEDGSVTSQTVRTLGYDFGVGLLVNDFFVELRQNVLFNVQPFPVAGGTNMIWYPVTVGYWF